MLWKESALECLGACLGACWNAWAHKSWAHAWAPAWAPAWARAWAPAWARAWAPAWAPADRFFEFANANMRSRPLVYAFRLNWGRVLSSQSFENGAGVLQALGAGLGAGLGSLGARKSITLPFWINSGLAFHAWVETVRKCVL